ncbi:MAG: molybdopterin molybdenumtransferase MoeA [Candidatus Poribacteria bacterium]|nr:MAG: molybdopterin molybdenumtransferase MoeA [Candidatus Poribacteria bacterium]
METPTPMLSVAEAQERMLAAMPILEAERVPLLEALGRALAEPAIAQEDHPPFDNSAMDGYALRSADVAGASEGRPVRLRVVEEIPAGVAPRKRIEPGTAARIMTGAMMPPGADAVVMVEQTRLEGDQVLVQTPVRAGENVRYRGENVRRGETVLEPGATLRPAELAMLAALNLPEVSVVRAPRVAVLSTGDELVPLGSPLEPGKIRDSNRFGLIGQVREAGAIPVDCGIVPDDRGAVERAVRRALQEADALVTSGGVSVGDYDVVREVLESLGELHFWRVAMKPGKPQAFGLIQGKPMFALPGNPVSSLVVFELFVRPCLRKMGGHRRWFRPQVRAVMEEPVQNDARGRTNFMRVFLRSEGGRFLARTTGPQGSGNLRSLVGADGLAVVAAQGVRVGEEVAVILLSETF